MAYSCQLTDPQSGVIVQSNEPGFMELWLKAGREQQAKEDRDRAALSAAGARYSQIRNGWFTPKGDWDTATEAEIWLVETTPQLAVGSIVGIWDCYDKSSRYLTLWTVSEGPRWGKTYKLAFKETLCSTAEAAS